MFASRDSRILRFGLILFFLILAGYALFEARGILIGPTISVESETFQVSESATVIRGSTERITELRLNGAPIPVTEAGVFEERFLLAEGSNYFVLEATDSRGRSTRKTLTIIYTPPALEPLSE